MALMGQSLDAAAAFGIPLRDSRVLHYRAMRLRHGRHEWLSFKIQSSRFLPRLHVYFDSLILRSSRPLLI